MSEQWYVTAVAAPVYRDEKMSKKKGKADRGTVFELERKNTEGTMLKTSDILYYEQQSGDLKHGDGWLMAGNCASVPPTVPDVPPPVGRPCGKKKYLVTVEELPE